MRPKLGGGFFIFLGTVVGILFGVAVSILQPDALKAVSEFFFNIKFLLFILFSYLILQFSVGVPFDRPNKSRALHLGMVAIPIAYGLLMHYGIANNPVEYLLYFMIVVLFLEMPIAYTMLITAGVSLLIWFFTGFDTRPLDNKNLDSTAISCYNLEFASPETADIKLIERIPERTGFVSWRGELPRNNYGGAIYKGSDTFLGVFCEIKNNVFNVVFVLFKIVNDTVVNIDDVDEALDFQGQLCGLFNSLVERKKIVRFDSPKANQKALEEISSVLGPLKIPSRGQIRESITRGIAKHRVLLWLIATIVGAAIVFILERSVSMIWP